MPKARILIVEDEALVGLELSESLERLGYSVLPLVSSGDDVLDAVHRGKPDLIVMDIHLRSFSDGVDASERVHLFQDVPVVYITAYNTPEIRERALRTRPVAYLLKPIEEKSLAEAIERGLGEDRGA